MKHKTWIRRKDRVRQRYWIGRKQFHTHASKRKWDNRYPQVDMICPECGTQNWAGVGRMKGRGTIAQCGTCGHVDKAEKFVRSRTKQLESKNYGSKVIETPEMRRLRERRGFDDIIEIDANLFADRFKRDQKEDLAWSSDRLKSAREREIVDSYPQITVSELTGKVDVNDGRHRLAVAAERGEQIKVAIKEEHKGKLRNALQPRPHIITFDEPTDGTRHENDPERVSRRQYIANQLIANSRSMISAAQEASDIEEREEKRRGDWIRGYSGFRKILN